MERKVEEFKRIMPAEVVQRFEHEVRDTESYTEQLSRVVERAIRDATYKFEREYSGKVLSKFILNWIETDIGRMATEATNDPGWLRVRKEGSPFDRNWERRLKTPFHYAAVKTFYFIATQRGSFGRHVVNGRLSEDAVTAFLQFYAEYDSVKEGARAGLPSPDDMGRVAMRI